ncbi:PEP-CTERM domain protein [Nostoc sp. PCC 7107]|uniref:PEP-CTERM domain protein n=1 Tax=Nostoc sp. PCC 7107 TaxID=317936 RepID=UPI00029EF0BA|nr:PEP-CTERM domain protein [Nostoc sp. PCC 7107]AFY45342.1 hypothetical protein Nos7107_4823 [Nostoc sp. PCC 7107]
MTSIVVKIRVCAASFAVIGALGQQPLWAFSNTSLAENTEDMNFQPEATEDGKNIDSTNHDYTPSLIPQPPTATSAAPLSTYIHPYSNRWTNLQIPSPRPRQVPESSAVLGLMAIAIWFGTQYKRKQAQ